GRELFELIYSNDLEGIVAKRLDDTYEPRVRWLKIKNGDYSQKEGRSDLFNGPRQPSAHSAGESSNPRYCRRKSGRRPTTDPQPSPWEPLFLAPEQSFADRCRGFAASVSIFPDLRQRTNASCPRHTHLNSPIPGYHAFSSRLSSLKNRQSVPSAI